MTPQALGIAQWLLQWVQREERDDPVNPVGMTPSWCWRGERKRQTPQDSLLAPRCELPAASRERNKTQNMVYFWVIPPPTPLRAPPKLISGAIVPSPDLRHQTLPALQLPPCSFRPQVELLWKRGRGRRGREEGGRRENKGGKAEAAHLLCD